MRRFASVGDECDAAGGGSHGAEVKERRGGKTGNGVSGECGALKEEVAKRDGARGIGHPM